MNLLQYSLFVILYFFLPSILISNIEQGIKNKEVGSWKTISTISQAGMRQQECFYFNIQYSLFVILYFFLPSILILNIE